MLTEHDSVLSAACPPKYRYMKKLYLIFLKFKVSKIAQHMRYYNITSLSSEKSEYLQNKKKYKQSCSKLHF